MRAALKEAEGLCPKFLDHKRKAEYVARIKKLLQPAYTSSDPYRKSYDPDYAPSDEERRAKAVELCHGHGQAYSFAITPVETTMESTDKQDSLLEDEGEGELYVHQDTSYTPSVTDSTKYFFFVFGTVFGMLLCFIYLHVKDSSAVQVATHRSLRRPEL